MTAAEEREMHELAVQVAKLTEGEGWEAMRYYYVGLGVQKLTEFCAVPPSKELQDAIGWLLTELPLKDCEDLLRDEAKSDRFYDGLSEYYPRLQRFREVCATLRQAVGKELHPTI